MWGAWNESETGRRGEGSHVVRMLLGEKGEGLEAVGVKLTPPPLHFQILVHLGLGRVTRLGHLAAEVTLQKICQVAI
jgi:hypothetical protein